MTHAFPTRRSSELALVRVLDGEGGGERWLTLGGGATARSYGVLLQGHGQAALSPDCARERLRAAIPPPHLAFLRELKLFHEAGDYLSVHHGQQTGQALAHQDHNDLTRHHLDFQREGRPPRPQ